MPNEFQSTGQGTENCSISAHRRHLPYGDFYPRQRACFFGSAVLLPFVAPVGARMTLAEAGAWAIKPTRIHAAARIRRQAKGESASLWIRYHQLFRQNDHGAAGGNLIGVSDGVAVGFSVVAVPGGDANSGFVAGERSDGVAGETRCNQANTSKISAFREFRVMGEGELRKALRTARRSVEAAKATASPEELTKHLISAAQHLVFLMERIIEERKSSGHSKE